MHQCLSIIEVQRAIFQEIYRDLRCCSRATLAKLARTCHAFNNSALDALWTKLDSFVFLIRCLPCDLWNIKPTPDWTETMVFQRPMLLSDWEIFFKYSSRVRILCQTAVPCYGPTLSDDVIVALSNLPAYGPLAPQLKELQWDGLDRQCASLVRLLLTLSLDSLSLPGCALHFPEVSILTPVSFTCPSLKHLSITLDTSFDNIPDTNGQRILSDVLLRLHSLESLICPPLDEDTVVQVCHLLLLVDLSLRLQSNFDLEKMLPHVTSSAFASLHTLKLQADTLPILTSLLKPTRFTPESLSFVVSTTPTLESLNLFFPMLATACGSEKLTHVSLTMSDMDRLKPRPEVSLATFQALLQFPSIDTFEFDVLCDLVLDNEAIVTLTKSWPNLISLFLNPKSGWGVTSRVTHKGLLLLLFACSLLSELAIAIDFSHIDVLFSMIPKVRPGRGMTNSYCFYINFATSMIHNPATIAAFLSDICPQLSTIKCSWDDEDNAVWGIAETEELEQQQQNWDEVKNLLPGFVAVRRQCMNWLLERKKKKRQVMLA